MYREWRYLVSNKYGFNSHLSRRDDLGAAYNPHGRLANVPMHMPQIDIERLCSKLSACGVSVFDFEALYGTDKYPTSEQSFRNLMDYIYPCVRKYGPEVFRNRDVYRNRGVAHPDRITASDLLARNPNSVQAAFDATPHIDNINRILKEKPMSDAPKYDSQTGELIVTTPEYVSAIKFGGELEPGTAYKLEVVGGKNPPEVASPGTLVVALADSEGNYTGWVRLDDGTERTFETDDSDLYTEAD